MISFIGLYFYDNFLLKKTQFEKLFLKNRRKKIRKKFDFIGMYLPGPVPGICTADDEFFVEKFRVQ